MCCLEIRKLYPRLAPNRQRTHRQQKASLLAVGFAPLAEEYLFRGLLYRALDRDWSGWRAVLGAAAFFTVYHPLLAWPPVFCVGAVNCLLFKKTRRLLPCIVLHMTYNAVLLLR